MYVVYVQRMKPMQYAVQLLLCVKNTSGGAGLLVACMDFLAMVPDAAAAETWGERHPILCFFSSPFLFATPFFSFLCLIFAHRLERPSELGHWTRHTKSC